MSMPLIYNPSLKALPANVSGLLTGYAVRMLTSFILRLAQIKESGHLDAVSISQ